MINRPPPQPGEPEFTDQEIIDGIRAIADRIGELIDNPIKTQNVLMLMKTALIEYSSALASESPRSIFTPISWDIYDLSLLKVGEELRVDDCTYIIKGIAKNGLWLELISRPPPEPPHETP